MEDARKIFLFQGDSITDAGRDRDNLRSTDRGYVHIVSSDLLFSYPDKFEFYNRGISGNRIVDVYARIKQDIINLKPDYMTILIGINDVWHEIMENNGVDAQKFKTLYKMLIEEITRELPDITIFILEPFVLQGKATTEHWDIFEKEVAKRAVAAKEVAGEYNLSFIPLQQKFNDALNIVSDTSYWLNDGVHPNQAGQQLIANEILACFKKCCK